MQSSDPCCNLFVVSVNIVVNSLRDELVAVDTALLNDLAVQKDTSWERKKMSLGRKGVELLQVACFKLTPEGRTLSFAER